MKIENLLLLLCLLFIDISYSQAEANNWFFGNGAGLDFSSGTPIAVNNGQLFTIEGCASISNSNGDLLFYTDGSTVFTKSSAAPIMPNGTNLHGNSSSSQSAIIVPKPDSDTLFYIFTVDEHINNLFGLQYSLVDMTLNGGLGDVVATEKNVPLLEHAAEKITAVQGDDCNSIWVIAFASIDGTQNHAYETFHAFEVTVAGINPPVSSTFSTFSSDGRGYLKVSPDATKVCVAHHATGGQVFLYDFNNLTGVITNEETVQLSDISHPNNNNFALPYGIEFSLDTSKLYITSVDNHGVFNATPSDGYLWQIDLEDPTYPSTLISFNGNSNGLDTYRGALQLGPDGKIYRALSAHYDLGSNFLGVINNPQADGLLCNYQHDAINLGVNSGGQPILSRQGLPPFIQSLFLDTLEIVIAVNGDILDSDLHLCQGETFVLEPDTTGFPTTTTFVWTQTDAANVSTILPVTTSFLNIDFNDLYADGQYKLEVDFNDGSCPLVGTATITYHSNPILNPVTIKQCDDDSDGISNIDLTILYDQISANAANETIFFYETQAQAIANDIANAIPNITNYITNSQTIWASAENQFGCTSVSPIDIIVTVTSINFHPTFSECDDFLDVNGNDNANNDDRDGISNFNFNVTNTVINLFPVALQPTLSVAYYHNTIDGLLQQNEILNISNYRNITSINYEKIYIRVNTTQNLDCVAFGENLFIELFVEALPTANTVTIQKQCDDDQDGFFAFNTSAVTNAILQGQNNVELTYFNEDGTQIIAGFGNDLPNPFSTSSQTITIIATNATTNDPDGACIDETTLEFIVDRLPFIADTPIFEPECEELQYDDDQMFGFDTSLVEYFLRGNNNSQLDMDILYFDEIGNPLPSPLPDPFVTATQNITAQIVNPLNLTCPDSTQIEFVVNPRPEFDIDNAIICLNNLPNPITVDITNVANTDIYTYQWFDSDQNDISINANDRFLDIFEAGVYTVTATTTDGNFCTKTKEFIVTQSSITNIETITIFDNLPNNQITVLVSGQGNYEFSIDHDFFEPGNTPTGHIFSNVPEGLRTITIRDLNGCGEIQTEVPVIRFPKFFTPNGDGINENWHAIGKEAYPTSTYTIFDRHGKVITQFTKDNIGWDGTYIGKIAPETDYWFLAVFTNTKGVKIERRGHFSLML